MRSSRPLSRPRRRGRCGGWEVSLRARHSRWSTRACVGHNRYRILSTLSQPKNLAGQESNAMRQSVGTRCSSSSLLPEQRLGICILFLLCARPDTGVPQRPATAYTPREYEGTPVLREARLQSGAVRSESSARVRARRRIPLAPRQERFVGRILSGPQHRSMATMRCRLIRREYLRCPNRDQTRRRSLREGGRW